MKYLKHASGVRKLVEDDVKPTLGWIELAYIEDCCADGDIKKIKYLRRHSFNTIESYTSIYKLEYRCAICDKLLKVTDR